MNLNLEQFIAALHDYIGKALTPIVRRLDAVEQFAPEKGAPGADGKSVTVDDVLPALKSHAEELIAAIPVPKDGRDGVDGKSVSLDDIKSVIEPMFASWALGFEQRAQDILMRCYESVPKPKDGRDGADGRDGTSVLMEDVLPALKSHAEELVAAIPAPRDGRDGLDGKSVTVEDVLPELKSFAEILIADQPKPRDGIDGAPGADGKSVTVDDVLPALKSHAEELIAAIPVPKDGRDGVDGTDGIDGKSVTLEEVDSRLESNVASWALDFERRAQDLLMRCIETAPKPKDGRDGADGRDGVGFDDLDLQHDGCGNLTIRFARGEEVKEFALNLPVFIDRGVYREDVSDYKSGNGVTFGGNFYLAQKDNPIGKPGLSEDWRLACKKGRDGKNYEPSQK